jgi:Ser/Thr protein kinase RdoA (MazF antagonist)
VKPELEQALRQHYGLHGPFEVAPLAAEGHNNTLRAFRSPGGSFVWKRGGSALGPVQRREFGLLEWLNGQSLPFSMAAPLRTRDGAWGWEEDGLNVLLPFLQGEGLPEAPDAWQALGVALKALHEVLARYPQGEAPWPLDWANLHQLHAGVPDPLSLSLERPDLWGSEARARAWRGAFQETLSLMQGTYADLPRQVVHADFNSVNVLFAQGRVSAVLDFEFSCLGPPVLDVATALSEVLVRPDPAWALAQAFFLGYGALTAAEHAALPAAMLLRQAAVGVWGLGQALDDGVTMTTHARLGALVSLQTWLKTHGAGLATL